MHVLLIQNNFIRRNSLLPSHKDIVKDTIQHEKRVRLIYMATFCQYIIRILSTFCKLYLDIEYLRDVGAFVKISRQRNCQTFNVSNKTAHNRIIS